MNGNRRFYLASAVVLAAAVAPPAMATWNLTIALQGRPPAGDFEKFAEMRTYAAPDQAGPFTTVPKRLGRLNDFGPERNVRVPDSTESVTIQAVDRIGSRARRSSYNLDIARQQLRQVPIFHNTLPNRNVGFVFEDVDMALEDSMFLQRFHVTNGRFDDSRLSWITVYDMGSGAFITRLPDGTPTSPLLRTGWMRLDARLILNPAPGALGALGLASLLGASRRRR